jgi:hypothetical protein
MLIYDPALDPYHSAIRILTITLAAQSKAIELTFDAARIADYFLVYPAKIVNFTFPAQLKSLRTAAKELENPYRQTLGNRATFDKMRPIFLSALSGLVAAGYIDEDALKSGVLKPSNMKIPEDLAAAVDRFQIRQTTVGKFVLSDMLAMRPNGDNGLKHRSKLIEHRYDIV